MGYFVCNTEHEPTVRGSLQAALDNLELYLPYCSTGVREGRYKDELGQTPPDYLVKDFAMSYLRDALKILESRE